MQQLLSLVLELASNARVTRLSNKGGSWYDEPDPLPTAPPEEFLLDGETTSSEVLEPSSLSPSLPIRGCSWTTPANGNNRGLERITEILSISTTEGMRILALGSHIAAGFVVGWVAPVFNI